MNVRELIEALQKVPQDSVVIVEADYLDASGKYVGTALSKCREVAIREPAKGRCPKCGFGTGEVNVSD